MGKYKFTMRSTKPNTKGQYAILLELSNAGKRSYVSLKIYGERKFWDEVQERFVIEKGLRTEEAKDRNNERKNNNALLERANQRAIAILDDFEAKKMDWTVSQFKDVFVSRVKQGKFYPYLTSHIEVLRETDHIGNAKCYESLLTILTLFDTKLKERAFGEVNIKYVKKLDVFLQKRKNTGNTRKYYLKTLRSIINKAIQDGEATASTYPFGKGGFAISALEEQTTKRYLPDEYLIKLKTERSVRPVSEYARNLFLFSYYCYGMSIVDMAHLKLKNIVRNNKGRYIVYKREKTKTQRNANLIQIMLTEELECLIKELTAFREPVDDYVLPIVTITDEGEKLYTHIRNKSKRYNEYLKKLAEEFGFEFNLTSYVSRHTMAMQLQNNTIPREVISQIMGHKDLHTTNTYLDSLDNSIIDEATKVL